PFKSFEQVAAVPGASQDTTCREQPCTARPRSDLPGETFHEIRRCVSTHPSKDICDINDLLCTDPRGSFQLAESIPKRLGDLARGRILTWFRRHNARVPAGIAQKKLTRSMGREAD